MRGREADSAQEEPGEPEQPRFGPAELGPDSGVYFIEQLLQRDVDGAPQDASAVGARPSSAFADPPATESSVDEQRSDDSAAPPVAEAAALAVRGRRRRRPTMERRLAIVLIVLVVVSLGLAAAVVVKSRSDADAADRAARQFASEQAAAPSVVVIGDQADVRGLPSVPTSQQWPAVLATELRGRVVALASSGAGYVTKGASGSTFVSEAKRVPHDASIVIFIGGAADSRISSMRVVKAATLAFSEAAQQAPNARVIAIGPLPSAQTSATETKALRQILRVSAATAGITWADPIGSTWVSASAAQTPGGEQMIAGRVRALIDAPSPSPSP